MNIEHAIQIAVKTHTAQRDKAGQPYILHSLRMMFAVETKEERIAVVHDVIEDCAGWTFESMKIHGFSPAVLEALDSVTKRTDEDYMTFVESQSDRPTSQDRGPEGQY